MEAVKLNDSLPPLPFVLKLSLEEVIAIPVVGRFKVLVKSVIQPFHDTNRYMINGHPILNVSDDFFHAFSPIVKDRSAFRA